jgi:hypothetical protein
MEFIDLVKCPLSTEEFLAAKKERLASGLRILDTVDSSIHKGV